MSEHDDRLEIVVKALEPYDIPTGRWSEAEREEPARVVLAALDAAALSEPSEPEVWNRWTDCVNERVALRAAVYRMFDAVATIEGEAMRLLHGRTDAWVLIDAVDKAIAAWVALATEYPEPYDDSDLMLRMAGCVLDVRPTAPKGLACTHPEHAATPTGEADK